MNTVAAIAASVQSGERSAVDVVEDSLAAAEADTLNAFTTVQRAGALERAREIDARIRAGDAPGPLTGVPVAVKDLIHHAGQVTTAGSSFYRHHAEHSAPVLDRLEAAGAVIVGRTGLHEFAYGFNSENEWFGPVHNPWDPALSPGGSSGGSGAAVGAGIVPAALGTDTGGSVRVPAALCGAVGLKVTHGRVPISGVFPLAESLDTVGPIAATVDDARRVYEVIEGDDPADPWSVAGAGHEGSPMPLASLRIGIPQEWLAAAPTTSETATAFRTALDRISDLGAQVIELSSPTLAPSQLGWSLSAAEAAALHRDWFADPDKRYGQEIESRLAAAMEVSLDEFLDARRWQASLVGAARRAFQTVHVLATPTVGHPRKTIGVDTITVGDKEVHHRQVLASFTATVNQMWCPAIALPLIGTGTPPHSLHLIGPWWSEAMLLDVGSRLESAGIVGFQRPEC